MSKSPLEASRTRSPIYGEVRQQWLDVLRAIAILLVLGTHYQINWHDAGVFVPYAALNMRVGWSGVDLFFVISGFLIGGLLFSEHAKYGKIDLLQFYGRRALKIWPLLYSLPFVFVVFSAITGEGSGIKLQDFTPVFFHVQNYLGSPMGHLWSLAVEEHFYVLLPLLITGMALVRPIEDTTVPKLLICTIVAVGGWRTFAVFHWHLWAQGARLLTHFRIDGLLFGVLLAWLFRYRRATWDRLAAHPVRLLSAIVVLSWPFMFNPNTSLLVAGPGFTSLFVAYGALLILFSRFSEVSLERNWRTKMLNSLAWIGRFSFPIYLFHPFIWLSFNALGLSGEAPPPPLFGSQGATWLLGYLVFFASSIAAGAAIGFLAERPLLALRNRLMPPRVAPLPGAPLPSAGC